ncbi:MAG: hypothetical protein ACREL6_13600, partial [Gemmatimonadales bacterium]
LLVVHYFWVVRSDAAFLETAVESSAARVRDARERQARGVHQPAITHRSPWFQLRSTGPAATAILWKNILQTTRKVSPGLLGAGILTALLVPALASVMGEGRWATMIGAFGLGVTGMLVVFGPVRVRNDLRGDLAHMGQLRTWPVESSALVAAEVSAAVIVLTVWEYGMVLLSVLALGFGGEITRVDSTFAASLVGVLLLLPVVNVFAVILHNAGVLLFPAWVRSSPNRGGVEALGQQMLAILATFLMILLCLLPPVMAGAAAYTALQETSSVIATASAAGLFVAGCLLEVWLLLSWLGKVFARLDPSEIRIEDAG